MAVEDSIIRSKRTARFPGAKEQSVEYKIWDRINEHGGRIRYQINRDTPSIVALYDALGQSEQKLLDIVFSQIECYLPKYSIVNDSMDALTIINSDANYEDEQLIQEIKAILALCDPSKRKKMFDDVFVSEAYQRLLKCKEEIRKRVLHDD